MPLAGSVFLPSGHWVRMNFIPGKPQSTQSGLQPPQQGRRGRGWRVTPLCSWTASLPSSLSPLDVLSRSQAPPRTPSLSDLTLSLVLARAPGTGQSAAGPWGLRVAYSWPRASLLALDRQPSLPSATKPSPSPFLALRGHQMPLTVHSLVPQTRTTAFLP